MAERWYARYSRLFDHTFTQRQPLILYASHPHFAQTNVTPGAVNEGTGGFTERTKRRIALPFAAGLGETDHDENGVRLWVYRERQAPHRWYVHGLFG